MGVQLPSTTADAAAPDAHPAALPTDGTQTKLDKVAMSARETSLNPTEDIGDTENDHAVHAVDDMGNIDTEDCEGEGEEEEEFCDDGDDEEDESDEEEDGAEGSDDDDEDGNQNNLAGNAGLSPQVVAHLLSKNRLSTKALHAAAASNDVETIKQVLNPAAEPKVDVNVTDAFEYTALHIAAEHGALDAVKLLIDAGASLEPQSRMYQCRPMHYAAFEGHTSVVQALVEEGADINALTEDGRTPLFQAALRGHLDCVKALLQLKADPTIANAEDKTAADVAATTEIVDAIEGPAEKKARTE